MFLNYLLSTELEIIKMCVAYFWHLGFVLNHMHEKTGNNDYNAFAKGLSELATILRQLSKLTRIVWMLQAPAIHGANTFKPQFTAKIHHYNAGLLKILK